MRCANRFLPTFSCLLRFPTLKQKEDKRMSTVSIRYMIDDAPVAIQFFTTHLGFSLDLDPSPAFASVTRDGRLVTV